jgi:hypothetical protein
LAAVVAAYQFIQADRRAQVVLVCAAIPSAAIYAWAHYALFGALTPYSVGTVYAGESTGEVLNAHLGIREQAYRLYGIFIDRRFGIGRWAPVLFVALAGIPLLFRMRAGSAVAAALAAQLFMATFVAITMMGWWFPGRTMATVIPLLALPLALLVDRFGRPAAAIAGLAAVYSALITVVLAEAGHAREIVIAVDPFELSSPLFAEVSRLFPQYTSWGTETRMLTAIWLVGGTVSMLLLYRRPLASSARRAKTALEGWTGLRPTV